MLELKKIKNNLTLANMAAKQFGAPPVFPPVGQTSDEADKKIEDINELIATHVEHLILDSKYLNEGNNGVIFSLKMEDVDPAIIADFKKIGIDLENNESVAKILKIYRPGTGRHEFEMQKKAYDLISKQPNQENYATAPRPLLCQTVKLSQPTLEKIQQSAVDGVMLKNSAEVIVMDFVPGTDLATLLYREAGKQAKDLSLFNPNLEDKEIDQMSINELAKNGITEALGFERTRVKTHDEDKRKANEDADNRKNASKLISFLRSTTWGKGGKEKPSLTLNKKIITQVKNTIALFIANGLYLPDLHQRNLMLNGDWKGSDAVNSVIIDYGEVREIAGSYNASNERADNSGSTNMTPESIIKFVEIFALTPEEEETKAKIGNIDSITRKAKILIEQKPESKAEFQQFIETVTSTDNKTVALVESYNKIREKELSGTINDIEEAAMNKFGLLLRTLIDSNVITPEQAKDSIKELTKGVTNNIQRQNNAQRIFKLL